MKTDYNAYTCNINFKRFKNKSIIHLFEIIPFNYYISYLICKIKNKRMQTVLRKHEKNKFLDVDTFNVNSAVYYLLKLNDKQIVAAFYNGEIILFTLKRSIECNKDKINQEVVFKSSSNIATLHFLVKLNEKQIISAEGDDIKIWDLINLKVSKIIECEYGCILSIVKLSNDKIITGHVEGMLYVWDIITGTVLIKMNPDRSPGYFFEIGNVYCLTKLNKDILLSGHDFGSIRILISLLRSLKFKLYYFLKIS